MSERPAEISLSEAARMADCSPDTVMHWIEEGAIAAWQTSPHGWWRIECQSLMKYLTARRRVDHSGQAAVD